MGATDNHTEIILRMRIYFKFSIKHFGELTSVRSAKTTVSVRYYSKKCHISGRPHYLYGSQH